MNFDGQWPISRPPGELLAQVRRRARLRRATQLGQGAAAILVVAGALAVVNHSTSNTNVRTIDGPTGARHQVTRTGSDQRAVSVPSSVASGASGASGASTVTTATPAPKAPSPALVGIDATSIRIGNVSTLTGAGAAIGTAALAATKAAVAYQNSIGGIWGRQIVVDSHDDLSIAERNRSETAAADAGDFALAGSASLQDDASAATVAAASLPDASQAHGSHRQAVPNNFTVEPSDVDTASTTTFLALRDLNPTAVQTAGTLFFTDDTSKRIQNAATAAAAAAGWKFAYSAAVTPTDANFTTQVMQMRSHGVRAVYLTAVSPATSSQFAAAMRSQHFQPDLFVTDGPAALAANDPQAEGAIVPAIVAPTGAGASSDVGLFHTWMARTAPTVTADDNAALAWAETRLLFDTMASFPTPTPRARIVDALRTVAGFSAGDLVAPATPASKQPSVCRLLTRNQGGQRVRLAPGSGFRCDGKLVHS